MREKVAIVDKSLIYEHFAAILDKLMEQPYFKYYFQCPWSLDDDVKVNDRVSIKFGASRGCIVDKDFPYVVKFDLYIDNEDDIGTYCKKEVDAYEVARRARFSNYLVECGLLGVYHNKFDFYDVCDLEDYIGSRFEPADKNQFTEAMLYCKDEEHEVAPQRIYIPLYYYEKIDAGFAFEEEYDQTIKTDSSSYKQSPLIGRTARIGYEFVREYGRQEYIEFSRFLAVMGVDDIHIDNVGSKGGKLHILDWAGYKLGGGF